MATSMSQNSPTPLSGRISNACCAASAVESPAPSELSLLGATDGDAMANSMPPPSSAAAVGCKITTAGHDETWAVRLSSAGVVLLLSLSKSAGLCVFSSGSVNQLPHSGSALPLVARRCYRTGVSQSGRGRRGIVEDMNPPSREFAGAASARTVLTTGRLSRCRASAETLPHRPNAGTPSRFGSEVGSTPFAAAQPMSRSPKLHWGR